MVGQGSPSVPVPSGGTASRPPRIAALAMAKNAGHCSRADCRVGRSRRRGPRQNPGSAGRGDGSSCCAHRPGRRRRSAHRPGSRRSRPPQTRTGRRWPRGTGPRSDRRPAAGRGSPGRPVRFGLAAGGAPAVVVVEVVPGDVGVTDGMSGVLVGRGVATVRSAAAASLGGLTSSAVVRSTIASTADMISGRSRTLPEPRFRLPAEGRGLPTEHLESLAGDPSQRGCLGSEGAAGPGSQIHVI
jgi:hypothetical protein